jgi:hypothetical protein
MVEPVDCSLHTFAIGLSIRPFEDSPYDLKLKPGLLKSLRLIFDHPKERNDPSDPARNRQPSHQSTCLQQLRYGGLKTEQSKKIDFKFSSISVQIL